MPNPSLRYAEPARSPDPIRRARWRAGAVGLLLAGLVGCTSVAQRESDELWGSGNYEAAVAKLREASQKRPNDIELRAAYVRLRDRTATQLVLAADGERLARHYDDAVALYRRALGISPGFERAEAGIKLVAAARGRDVAFAEAQQLADKGDLPAAETRLRGILTADPGNFQARRMLQQLRARQAPPEASTALRTALATPITVDFHDTPLRSVFDALSKTAGLNFVFDRDVRPDTKVNLTIRNNSVDDAIRLLLATSGLERKILNDNSLLIYPSNQAKAREYQDQVVRTFYLVNADAKQAQNMLRTLARTRDIFIDEKLNMIAIRDTPEAVRLAEQLIAAFDVAEAEVMLEVEVMEISRTKLLDLGLNFPTQVNLETTTPFTPASTGTGVTSTTSEVNLRNANLTTTIANPALRLNLLSTDTHTNLLANPRIRVKNREKAKVQVGEKLPVFSSTAVQGAGVASSVSYIDVGLKLEVEPAVTLDGDVTMKVNLEVSSNLGTVNSTSSAGTTTGFELGTRNAQTTLQVHDGETEVIGGLINDNLTDTFNKLPGLGDLPGIGRLFGETNLNREKSEIVLLITPRVIRNLAPPDFDAQYLQAGTDSAVGARPLSIAATAPRSLVVSAGDAAGAAGGTDVNGIRRLGRTAIVDDTGQTQMPAAPSAVEQPLPPPAATLQVAPQVALGAELAVGVEVENAVGAGEGDVVLSFNPSQLQAPAAGGGATVTVHVTGNGSGGLAGNASLKALSAGAGTSAIAVTDGHLKMADGSERPIAIGASATVTITP